MPKNSHVHTHPYKFCENIISAISIGTVFILIGTIYVTTLPTSLWDKIVAFFSSFKAVEVPNTAIYLPAPTAPAAHTTIYNATFQFCLGIAVLQTIVLILRLILHSPISKIAETIGNLIFWFGATALVPTFLNNTTTITRWFAFWATILITLGASMIARALVLLIQKRIRPQNSHAYCTQVTDAEVATKASQLATPCQTNL